MSRIPAMIHFHFICFALISTVVVKMLFTHKHTKTYVDIFTRNLPTCTIITLGTHSINYLHVTDCICTIYARISSTDIAPFSLLSIFHRKNDCIHRSANLITDSLYAIASELPVTRNMKVIVYFTHY